MGEKMSFEEALEAHWLRPFVRMNFEIAPLRKAARLGHIPAALQVACLCGDSTAQLQRRFDVGKFFAVDKSEELVALARAKHGGRGVEFGVMDIPALAFADASFDAVINLAELHNYADWRAGLAEMVRVLKPGGHLIMNDLVRDSFERGMGPYYKKKTVHPYEAMMREDELRAELKARGLELLHFARKNPFGFIKYVVVVARKE